MQFIGIKPDVKIVFVLMKDSSIDITMVGMIVFL